MTQSISEWQNKLSTFSTVLDYWLTVQRSWMELSAIFSAADIQRQLPTESKLFHDVDNTFRKLMKRAMVSPMVLSIALKEGVAESLQQTIKNLELIQKGLDNYLEAKRLAFPRFYFLADNELLDILAHIRDPMTVQPYLKKCFESMYF